jgi:hypothetical protein
MMSDLTKPKPNFFIVGAAKSGTTSLWMYLKQHPDIFMPPTMATKEPGYFCHLYGIKNYEKYLSIFDNAKGMKAIGEASHAYLSSPESANWIKNFNPQAKIIIILRNPVERAYSLYNWMISEGYEWIFPFEKALEIEDKRLKDEEFKHNNPIYWYNYLYFNSGLYSKQIQRYLKVFPEKQIRIFLFEDLIKNPVNMTQGIYHFLEVDSKFIPKNTKIYNQQKTPRFVRLQFFCKQKLPKYLNKLRFPKRQKIQREILKINCSIGKNKNINLNTRKQLQNWYKKDIEKTADLINRDLQHWLD